MTNNELFLSLLEIMKTGKAVNLKIAGWSMSPMLLPERDSLVLASTREKLKRGDVVLYQRDCGKYIVHRIYKINQERFFMIGDGETKIEGPLKRDQIFASAIGAYRKDRYLDFNSFRWKAFTQVWLLVRPFRSVIRRCVTGAYRFVRHF